MPLTEIWREVSRHRAIAEVLDHVGGLLRRTQSVQGVCLLRLDAQRMRLETAAGSTGVAVGRARTELTAAQMRTLLGWAREGRVVGGRAGQRHPVLEVAVPSTVTGDVAVGALVDAGEVLGVLVLVTERSTLTAEHEALVQRMLEPMAVALRNDMRLHELTRLREALEADKQTLLSRLGRQEIADAIVGAEMGLRVVMERIEQVAHTDVPVLILGETGSGKEVIARAIHAESARAEGPVVRVNCGAIPAGLIDSELFGHERGSFTGAVNTRAGWFERADGGTLFLDEIGELPLEAQVRLLRVLQDGTFERVGGHQTQRVDVRLVAATHRDLHTMVREGTFREDLWYRISVFPIRLPPLRERTDDIPALAEHFARRAGERLGLGVLPVTPADVGLLRAYPWPGNVRELSAVMERAALLGGGRRLDVAGALGGSVTSAAMAAPASVEAAVAPASEFLTLDQAMAGHIEQALRATGGRIEGERGAAVLLGINPHTLRARMRKLGIAWSHFRAHPRAAS